MDLRREKDIEQLRKVALVQQSQLERLLTLLTSQSDRIDALTGADGELQRAIEFLERSGAAPSQDDARRPRRKKDKPRRKRETFGATPQPELPVHEELFELDDADTA